MFDALDVQLTETREKMRRQGKLQAQLAQTQATLAQERVRMSQLQEEMTKEGTDVDKLERVSLTALFYAILGSKDEQLEKERQEYLAARLKYDASVDAVSALEAELAEIQEQLSQLGDLNAEYQSILARKETYILATGHGGAERLLQVAEELGDAQSDLRELQEAISAGGEVLVALEGVLSALTSARGWGTWDMLGGDFLATAIKHGKIDEARAAAHRVQQLLGRFRRELADVAEEPDIAIEITPFETFADYFLDGLIFDWVVQAKIETSLQRTVEMDKRVRDVLARLHEEQGQVEHRVASLRQQRQQSIEQA